MKQSPGVQLSNYARSRLAWIAFSLGVLALFLIQLLGFEPKLRSTLEWLLRPYGGLGYQVSRVLVGPYQTVSSLQRSAVEYDRLRVEYNAALANLERLRQLESENQVLRQVLENSDRKLNTVAIAAPINSYGDPYLSKGALDGIGVGDVVVTDQTLVGRIVEVTPHQAKVQLLTHPQSLPILAETQRGVESLIAAQARKLIMTEVSLDTPVEVGDRVSTLGQAGIPKGLFIGRVVSVESVGGAQQRIVVEQLVNFYNSTYVEVRKPE